MFHVKRWWDRDIHYTIGLVWEKYSSYAKGYKIINGVRKPIQGFIIQADQTPIGYIQIYNAYDFPRSKPLSRLPENLGALDIFIGEMKYLRQSLGSKAISEFLKLHDREYSHIFADPDSSNFAAVKCYEKAGFKEIWNRDIYAPNQRLMLKEIKTPPFDTSVTEDSYARDLPPRTQDVKLIASIFKSRPIKISSGFCGMCDSNITDEWVLSNDRPSYELRHLVDVGRLRKSELEIIIRNLEEGTLDNCWTITPTPHASHQKPSPIPNVSFKSLSFFSERTNWHGRAIPKLYNLIINTYLALQYLFFNFRKFFIKSRIKFAKNRWFLSKNLNYYNPTLEATVFRNGGTWRIARHGHYFGSFEFKEDAMNEVF